MIDHPECKQIRPNTKASMDLASYPRAESALLKAWKANFEELWPEMLLTPLTGL